MIADYAGAVLVTIAVIVLLVVLGVGDLANRALRTSRQAFSELADNNADDEAKQRIAQQASLRLLAHSGSIALRLGMAFGVPALAVWVLEQVGAVDSTGVLRAGLSWPFLVATVGALAVMLLLNKARPR